MGAFKQFNSQDIIISPLQLTKGFEFKGGGILATASLNISSSAQYTASNYYSIERYLGNKFKTTGSTGEVVYPYFINNPQSYMTSIGLYNDSNELLAVAKLSKPLNKNFTKEALVRVKLDF